MPGRKTKYTPQKAQELIKLLSGGATIRDACAYVGITDDTLLNWCKRDSEFSASIEKARSTGKIECAALVRQAARSNWQAAAWFLERSDPEHWGRRTYAKIEGLDELLKLAQLKGINASDLFNSMIAELAAVDTSTDDSEAGG